MYTSLHVSTRYSCQILKKLEFSPQIFVLKYQILWKSVVLWQPSCSTRMDANNRFSQFRESALKYVWMPTQACAFQFLTILEIMATSDVIASLMPFFFPPLSSMIIFPLHLTFYSVCSSSNVFKAYSNPHRRKYFSHLKHKTQQIRI